MANVRTFDRALQKFEETEIERHTRESFNWFRSYVTRNLRPTMRNVMNAGEWAGHFTPGSLFTYIYDAKYKDTLPYWDSHPLIIFLRYDPKNRKNFYGVNLHYLTPYVRQRIFEHLINTLNNKKLDETTKIRANYAKMCSLCGSKYIEHAVKQYSINHLKSMIIRIDPKYWEIITFLPYHRFQKKSAQTVWKI